MRRPAVDVAVIGGGPAGLATALAAHRLGLRAVVLDKRQPPLDKPCGEGLMPDGLAALERLGAARERLRHHRLVGIRYLDGEIVVSARFNGAPGAGIRRTNLHRALLEAAQVAGIDLRWGTACRGLHFGDQHRVSALDTDAGPLTARFVVAADGLRSSLRTAAGLDGRPEARRYQRFGVRRHLRLAPWTDHVEVYWADRCEAYVTPVGPDEVDVACLWHGPARGWRDLVTRVPALVARLGKARATSRDAGCGPLGQRVRGVVRGNLALVGDAAGYVDAITGEGLSLAFLEAEALAEALAEDDLARYARAHRRICTWPDRLTRAVLALERRPALRRRALRALAREPRIFAQLLAVHTRCQPPRSALLPAIRLLARSLGG